MLATFPSRAYGSNRHRPISSPVASLDERERADVLVPPECLRTLLDPDAEHLLSEAEQAVQHALQRQEPPQALPIDPEATTQLGHCDVLVPWLESAIARPVAQGRRTGRDECLRGRSHGAVQRLERRVGRLDGSHRRRRGLELRPGCEAGELRDPTTQLEQLAHRLPVGRRRPLAEQPPEALADVPSPDTGEHLVARRKLDAEAPCSGCGARLQGVEQLGR